METITKQEIETLKQLIAQANPNGWTDWPGHGKSKRTHIGYLSNSIDGGTANIALFETNTNAKRADVLLAIYARNYLAATIIEIEQLRAELRAVLDVCIERGGTLGYSDDDYQERLDELGDETP